MSWTTFMTLVIGLCGLLLCGYGAAILLTRRAPRATRRAFRSLADAGRYGLVLGVAMLLFALGRLLRAADRDVLSVVAQGAALPLIVVAILRYRPRRESRGG